jgi:hypothetical protein
MDSHPLNRLFVIAIALPAAILIAAVAAMLDYVFPRGSWLNFLAAMLAMGLVIAGVMAGFVAACEACASWLSPAPQKAAGEARIAGRHFHPDWDRVWLPIRRMTRRFRHVGDCGHS